MKNIDKNDMTIVNHQLDIICLICARNEEKFIEKTIESLYNQTIKIKELIVVDDGSTDTTPDILAKLNKKYGNISVVKRKKRKSSYFSSRHFAMTYNEGLKHVITREFDYLLVLDADTILAQNYIKRLIRFFEKNPKVGILSGNDPSEKISRDHVRDTGRMIRSEIVYEIKQLPLIYSTDTYFICFARYLGFISTNEPRTLFFLQRPTGITKRNPFVITGYGMRQMGYHPLSLLQRFFSYILKFNFKAASGIVVGYLTADLSTPPNCPVHYENLKKFQYNFQFWYIIRRISKIITKK